MNLSRADLDRPIERAREASPGHRIVDIAVAVVQQTLDDQVLELAAALAYRFFMSLFPFFIFLTALSGFVAGWLGVQDPAAQLMNSIGSTLPASTSSLVEQQIRAVTHTRSVGLLTFGAIIALYLASAGVSSVMLATNQAYDVEESRSVWKRYGIALGLTLVGATVVIVAFVLFLAAQLFSQQILNALGLGAALGPLLTLGGWVVAFVMLFLATVMIYRVAPNLTLPWHRVAVGAAVFTIVWLIATWAFSLYLAHMANYTATFGALAGAVILLTWLYLTAVILLIGAELNAVLDAVARPDALEAGRKTAHEQKAGNARDQKAGGSQAR